MRTSTTFAGDIPENENDLHFLIYSFLEHETEFQKEYGLQKVFHTELNCYIGVAGLIRCNSKVLNIPNVIVEVAIFLKSKYIGGVFGFTVDGMLSKKGERNQNIMIASIWEGNKSSISLTKKYGGIFKGNATKKYKDKIINVNLYIKLPSTLKDFDEDIDIASLLFLNKKP